jgi:hypothetical protein
LGSAKNIDLIFLAFGALFFMRKYLSTRAQKIILWMLFCHFGGISIASEADTILNMVLSKPVFYNVMQNGQGEVFAGTAEGIYRIRGEALSQIDRRSGYIRFDLNGTPEIDSTGISNHDSFQFLHLLPYPDEKRQVYHTGTEEQFYMVSGGRLYIFDIVPYGISYRNQSIRSISRRLVGGYSGLYEHGLKLDFPSYTDGFIREFGDTAFICYGGLYRITPRDRQNYLSEVPFGAFVGDMHLGYVDDIIMMHVMLHMSSPASRACTWWEPISRNLVKYCRPLKRNPLYYWDQRKVFCLPSGAKHFPIHLTPIG